MSLDFQQVREQVILMGEGAQNRVERLQALQEKARETLTEHASNNEYLRGKILAALLHQVLAGAVRHAAGTGL